MNFPIPVRIGGHQCGTTGDYINTKQAIEYAKKIMVCETCDFWNDGCCQNDFSHDMAEIGYTCKSFGCINWSKKDVL